MSSLNPIPRATRRQDLVAYAGQTAFQPSQFKVYDALDIRVRVKAAGGTRFLTQTGGYTVSLTGAAPAFPVVTFTAGLAAGAIVRIEGARVPSRVTDVVFGNAIRANPLEEELDKNVVFGQEVRRDFDDIADRLDAVDLAVENATEAAASVAAVVEHVDAAAASAAGSAELAQEAVLNLGPGAADIIATKQYPAAAQATSLHTVLDASAIYLDGLLSPGATPADATANTAVINAATAAAKARGNRVPVVVPPGTWLVNFNILIRDNAPIVGRKGLSVLKLRNGTTNGNMLLTENYTDKANPTKNVHLEGLTIDINGAGQTGAGLSIRGIGIAYAAGCIIRDMTVKNPVDMGLWFTPDMNSLGTGGAYGGLPNPPNRPAGDPWVTTDVIIERCLFDASNATSTATDFVIPVSIQRLLIQDCTFKGGYRNTLGPEWCRDFVIRGNSFLNCASALYGETLLNGSIEDNYFEGIHQLNQADWNTPLHNTAIWLASGDDTLGSPTVNQYNGCINVEVKGNRIFNFSRPAPTAGNTQAGGCRGILVSGRALATPAARIKVHDNDIYSVQGAGWQAGLGGPTAFGVGIQTSGALQGVEVYDNHIQSCDVGIRGGGAYPDSPVTLGTITPSNDSHDTVTYRGNAIRDYTYGLLMTGGHISSAWEGNRVRAPRAGGQPVNEAGVIGTSFMGGEAAQVNEGTLDAWINTVPAVTGGGTPGAFAATAAVRFKRSGKTVHVSGTVTVTNMGTATSISLNLPVTPLSSANLPGFAETSGKTFLAHSPASSPTVMLWNVDGTLAAQAQIYRFQGTYEAG